MVDLIDPDRIGTRAIRPRDEGQAITCGKDTRAKFHRDRPRCSPTLFYRLLTIADVRELLRRKEKYGLACN